MATFVLTDSSVTINSVDLSDHGNQVSITYEAETQDDTVFGDTTRSSIGGLKNWSASVTFLQDFAASEVDATLFPAVGTTVPIIFKPTSGSVSATNPSYTATALVTSYAPMGSSVGDLASASVSLVPGGSAPALVRNVS